MERVSSQKLKKKKKIREFEELVSSIVREHCRWTREIGSLAAVRETLGQVTHSRLRRDLEAQKHKKKRKNSEVVCKIQTWPTVADAIEHAFFSVHNRCRKSVCPQLFCFHLHVCVCLCVCARACVLSGLFLRAAPSAHLCSHWSR